MPSCCSRPLPYVELEVGEDVELFGDGPMCSNLIYTSQVTYCLVVVKQ